MPPTIHSLLVHWGGGGIPKALDLPSPGDMDALPRVLAFAGLSTVPVDYNVSDPVGPPPWARVAAHAVGKDVCGVVSCRRKVCGGSAQRTTATRCDVYVHMWGAPGQAGDVRRWATWWALDGPDDGRCLRAVDHVAGLNKQVEDLERDRDIMWWGGGRRYTFEVFLTGNGKLMLVSNPGGKCWVYGYVGSMVPTDFLRRSIDGALFLLPSHQSVALMIAITAPAVL